MRVTAIGDLHGTLDNLLDIVIHLGYVDKNLDWIEPELNFLVIGDCCDRGYNSKDIYRLLIKWQDQAPEFGSRLWFVLGNHEVMNIFGYSQYNTEEEYRSFAPGPHISGEREFGEAFSPGGWVHTWLMKQKAVHKIGDLIFAHGDLPAALAGRTIEEINESVMRHLKIPEEYSFADQSSDPLFSADNSILWSRQAQYDRVAGYGGLLRRFLGKNRGSIYVCGHTPSRNGTFRHLYDRRYLCIDTGMVFMSAGMGSISALHIEDRKLTALYFYERKIVKKLLFHPDGT